LSISIFRRGFGSVEGHRASDLHSKLKYHQIYFTKACFQPLEPYFQRQNQGCKQQPAPATHTQHHFLFWDSSVPGLYSPPGFDLIYPGSIPELLSTTNTR